MHVPPQPSDTVEGSVVIEFNFDAFALMAQIAGASTDTERAALIGMNPKTLARARDGVIGHVFMARTVLALRKHGDRLARYNLTPSLDALFTVHEREPVGAR